MTTYAIRVIAPKRYAGDIFTLNQAHTRDDYERFRQGCGTPDNYEVVQLDDNWDVIEP